MRYILTLLCLIGIAYGQSTVYLRADSIKIMKQNGNANLQILNATRDSTNGVLINIGNGITKFQRIRAINDSQFTVGTDTISMAGGGGSSDPVAFLRNPTIAGYAILDFSSYVDTVYGKRLLPGFGWYADTTALTITGKVDTNNITSRLDRMKLRDSLLSIVQGNNGLTETANVIQLGGALIQTTNITPGTFELNIAGNGLGVSQTETSGLRLQNTTAATVGAQQISPAVYFRGSGWKTTATAAAQTVEVLNYLLPVQGTTAPTTSLVWEHSINGGAYANLMTVNSTGLQHIGSGGGGGISLSSSAPLSQTITSVSSLTFRVSSTPAAMTYAYFTSTGYQQTSGETNVLDIMNGNAPGFAPTSGTATHSILKLRPLVNQTGGANGISSGLLIDPTLTAAADFRAIYVIEGKSYFRNVHLSTAGDKLFIATGSNASTGATALVGGTITVSTTAVTASSIIHLTRGVTGGTVGHLSVGTITAATSFVINSTSGTETSTINWWIVN